MSTTEVPSADRPPSWAHRLAGLGDRMLASRGWDHPVLRYAAIAFAAVLFITVVTVPLDVTMQAIFAGTCVVLALVLRKVPGRLAILTMIMLSLIASLRYMYWRLTSTLGFETFLDAFFGFALLIAEVYALITLLLGYFQTAWPLQRRPEPLPADPQTWPSVDILIPTYNEPLSVVKQTVYNALAIDWPADKFKVFVLDDGRRPEFREFCEMMGVGYVTRDNNFHAKAGNINSALKLMEGEFVAIFDCDHIPTRSFLQVSIGWFLRDPKLAMLQTPHVFFSPDPFEKNLGTFRTTPNEGELFYGLIQDGNDLWNATFFCGSCAVLRRAPLLEVGGIAVETVTEDAHTALKMNRAGYNTAYLAIPQAAGLATESLSGHIGQRIRWARGMAQICRVDNPLFGPGLKLGQRLCYLNAMLHFFYGLPRLIFLTAPLAFLLFDIQIFEASALMITAYAMPHILHATMTNSRVQGQFRHSFWNEVYESVLAWYILRPVLVAFINPKLGKFNVTAKGGVIEKAYFDWVMARPYLILLLLNLAGFIAGIMHLIFSAEGTSGVAFTMLINLFWTFYNMLIVCACVAAASETRQVRDNPRVPLDLPAALHLPGGQTIACDMTDFSQGGIGIQLPEGAVVNLHEQVRVSLFRNRAESVFPADVVFARGNRVGLQLRDLTPAQQVEFAQMTFARADIWTREWGKTRRDAPLNALGTVFRTGARGFGLVFVHLWSMVDSWRKGELKVVKTKLDTGD